jgi:hypothetical protein
VLACHLAHLAFRAAAKKEVAMTSPADAIETEMRKLIEIQIQIFGKKSHLDDGQLEDHRFRSERIKVLGAQLDKLVAQRLVGDGFRKAR